MCCLTARWCWAADAGTTTLAQDQLLVQGGRQYSFSVLVTADTASISAVPSASPPISPAAVGDPSSAIDYLDGSITLTASVALFAPGFAGGTTYFPPVPPACSSEVVTNCQPVGLPDNGASTRRRLLAFERVPLARLSANVTNSSSASMYYSCTNPSFPCNSSLLSVVLDVPFSLSDQPLLVLQIRVQHLTVTVSSPRLIASPSSFNDGAAASSSPSPSLSSSSSTGSAFAYSDPRFHGFWHQQFYVSGRAGSVYCLISDRQVQLNAHFVQLQRIRCPRMADGSRMDRCFDHPGTFFGVLAISTQQGDTLRITAGDVHTGFHDVSLNQRPLLLQAQAQAGAEAGAEHTQQSSSFTSASISVQLLSARSLRVSVGVYELEVDNVDLYVDVSKVSVRSWEALVGQLRPEGLIGRTWNASLAAPADEEELELYREPDDDILGHRSNRSKLSQVGEE